MKILIGLFLFLAFSTTSFGQQTRVKSKIENFSVTSLDGTTFDLAALKGKVVLLTFWSTKCPICHSEIPKLNKLAQEYRGRNVVFLGLTMEKSNIVEKYMKKTNFDFTIIPDSFGMVLKFGDKSGDGTISMNFPAHFLLNQNGEVEVKTNGFDKTDMLDSRISKLLNGR